MDAGPDNNTLPFQINVIIQEKNNKPAVELRKLTTNNEIMKTIISCAFHERPLIIMPAFPNKLRSINSLIEKGIVYEEKGQFFFNI